MDHQGSLMFSFFFFLVFFIFLATPRGLQDLSSLTRDQPMVVKVSNHRTAREFLGSHD